MKSIPMRRARQALDEQSCIEILKRNKYGVLALNDPEGYPYQIPMNYAYADGVLIFHCATVGHKVDLFEDDPRSSFCVVDYHETRTELISSVYRSVVVTGNLVEIQDPVEKREALFSLSRACFEDITDVAIENEVEKVWNHVMTLKLIPTDICGKQAKELIGLPQ